MHDLDTIKRLNRNPSSNKQDKPAPQPTREDSWVYGARARLSVWGFAGTMQSPAMDREPLESE